MLLLNITFSVIIYFKLLEFLVYIHLLDKPKGGWSWLEVEHSNVDGADMQPMLTGDNKSFREKVHAVGPLFGVTIDTYDWRCEWRHEFSVQPPIPEERLEDFAKHMIGLATKSLIDPTEPIVFRHSEGPGLPINDIARSHD